MEWMLMPLRRYADFQGRSRRKEYWMFVLFQVLMMIPVSLVASFAFAPMFASGDTSYGFLIAIIVLLYLAAFLIPGIAVQVRRFHDQDKSGWFLLLGLIPYVGGLILLVFMCLEGTRGPNRFGPDPKDPYSEEVFA
jgi:uncharacterized membrane protein YhaH (DUF805 family)